MEDEDCGTLARYRNLGTRERESDREKYRGREGGRKSGRVLFNLCDVHSTIFENYIIANTSSQINASLQN